MKPDKVTYRDVIVTDGWEGFLNRVRLLFGRPLVEERIYTAVFTDFVIPPGESVEIELPLHDMLDEEML